MRVVDIINVSSSANTLLKERVLALRRRGIDNHIVCSDGPYVDALRAAGIPMHTVPVPRRLDPLKLATCFVQITTYLRRHQVDVVHTHCAIPGVVGRAAAWLAGVPVIVHTVHGFHFHEGMSWARRWPAVLAEKLCGSVTDTLLTQNQGDLDQAERYGIGPRGRRWRIGNGIDLTRFRPVPRTKSAGDPIILTCAARFEAVKNHTLLFEAVRLLAESGEPIRVWLVGEGELGGAHRELCAQLGIADLVEFLGYRDDIPELLARSDIGVLTSIKEGMPRAVLEAMAMGLPVVATRVPGTREAVVHDDTGFLVELDDARGLADALRRLIRDPALRERMGAAGRRRALSEFDERPIADALENLYRDRLGARRAAARATVKEQPDGLRSHARS